MNLSKTMIVKLFCVSLILGTTLMSCGGGKTGEKTDTTKNANNGENAGTNETNASKNTEPSLMCFESSGETVVSTYLKLAGDKVTGVYIMRTPGEVDLHYSYNIAGTKTGNKIDATITLMASDDSVGVGVTEKRTWTMEGDQLINAQGKDAFGGTQGKIPCEGETPFELKPQQVSANAMKYNLSGTINKKLKVKMYLETTEKTAGEFIYKGWYYYDSQGPDKKIKLKGAISKNGIMPSYLDEFTEGKRSGSFVIPIEVDLDKGLECFWNDPDNKNNFAVSLKLDSKK